MDWMGLFLSEDHVRRCEYKALQKTTTANLKSALAHDDTLKSPVALNSHGPSMVAREIASRLSVDSHPVEIYYRGSTFK